ncbi:hypothetical protein FOCC_FOCC015626 [Frankliniella occidentalis]|nr:hypothetical protein FOCC_FOCC015626 [Frankliniella occidentalis]
MTAKRAQITCHDLDIRRWALAAARKENCAQFKASLSWLRNFKKRHNIVSRKITKFVSRSDVQRFNWKTLPSSRNLASRTLLIDQSGCNYETHSGRTVEIAGERKVERVVQSKNATTHSFTIMPTMSASGVLATPLYIVQQSLFNSPNLKISCSQSGKMGKSHLEEFVTDEYIPAVGPKSCLVVDSWSTFTEANIRAAIPREKEVTTFKKTHYQKARKH